MGREWVKQLMSLLKSPKADLIECAYLDLLSTSLGRLGLTSTAMAKRISALCCDLGPARVASVAFYLRAKASRKNRFFRDSCGCEDQRYGAGFSPQMELLNSAQLQAQGVLRRLYGFEQEFFRRNLPRRA